MARRAAPEACLRRRGRGFRCRTAAATAGQGRPPGRRRCSTNASSASTSGSSSRGTSSRQIAAKLASIVIAEETGGSTCGLQPPSSAAAGAKGGSHVIAVVALGRAVDHQHGKRAGFGRRSSGVVGRHRVGLQAGHEFVRPAGGTARGTAASLPRPRAISSIITTAGSRSPSCSNETDTPRRLDRRNWRQ